MVKSQTLALESDPSHISGGAASGLGCVDSESYDSTNFSKETPGHLFRQPYVEVAEKMIHIHSAQVAK